MENNILTKSTAQSAWTPVENTYYHFLTIDMGDRKKIRKIVTRGRSRTKECVTEFIVQHSDDGELWRSFTDANAETQVFFFIMFKS